MIKYICAQPAVPYYLWQVEVMINNFLHWGIPKEDIHILLGVGPEGISKEWKILQNHYSGVGFYFYNDTRTDFSYIPAVYFNLMKQHLAAYPELKDAVLFTHDSDTVFTTAPQFDAMARRKEWYLSDTNSYLNWDYIQQKGNDVYEGMCDIIGIPKLIPKLMNRNSGGAQYIIRGVDARFWDKVETDSIKLYRWFCEIEPHYQKKHEHDYPIQKWTAGMWSYLWNGWLSGFETIVDDRLRFGWATDSIEVINSKPIFHNAGVTANDLGLFYKGQWIDKLPYRADLQISDKKASHWYWEWVKRVGENSPLTNLS